MALTDWMFRDSLVEVTVERGGGGLDRWGNPLPVETLTVPDCLIGPLSVTEMETLGEWSEDDARLFHRDFVFQQGDILVVSEGQLNAGRWEVQSVSSQWSKGTDTRVRRVNQR